MTSWALGLEGWLLVGGWAVVMLAAVILLVREPRERPPEDAAVILRARFARGELTEAEYRRAAAVLDLDPPVSDGARRQG